MAIKLQDPQSRTKPTETVWVYAQIISRGFAPYTSLGTDDSSPYFLKYTYYPDDTIGVPPRPFIYKFETGIPGFKKYKKRVNKIIGRNSTIPDVVTQANSYYKGIGTAVKTETFTDLESSNSDLFNSSVNGTVSTVYSGSFKVEEWYCTPGFPPQFIQEYVWNGNSWSFPSTKDSYLEEEVSEESTIYFRYVHGPTASSYLKLFLSIPSNAENLHEYEAIFTNVNGYCVPDGYLPYDANAQLTSEPFEFQGYWTYSGAGLVDTVPAFVQSNGEYNLYFTYIQGYIPVKDVNDNYVLGWPPYPPLAKPLTPEFSDPNNTPYIPLL